MKSSRALSRVTVLLCLLLVSGQLLHAQQIKDMQFSDQPITDILLALAKMSGNSIITDQTVTGSTSYYFRDTDFTTALHDFLAANHLFVRHSGSVYYVSRVAVAYDSAHGTVSVDADNVPIETIVQSLSRRMDTTILHDALPQGSLTLHIRNASLEAVLAILIRKYPDYSLEKGTNYFYIHEMQQQQGPSVPSRNVVTRTGDSYTVNAKSVRFREVVSELFSKGKREYSLLTQSDSVLNDLHYSGKSFDELLRLILSPANADYVEQGGVYYLFDIQRQDVLKQYKKTVAVPLVYLSVKDLPSLLPADLSTGNVMKLDSNTNTVILNGSSEEIDPVERFIRSVDKPLANRKYYRFDIKYMKVQDVLKTFPPQFSNLQPVVIPSTNSFVMLLSPQEQQQISTYVALIDQGSNGEPITLKYIQADDVLKNLPPDIDKSDITATSDTSVLFFTGTPEKRKEFMDYLSVVDKPIPQIRYELLVVQYQRSNTGSFSVNFQNSAATTSPGIAFLGNISQLLSLSVDVVSSFGYLFALQLNAQLTQDQARILADTTINGLSGQKLKFQNTNTYRYQELSVDTTTGQTLSTGVTREITSGLILNIDGWTSGDGMITMQVAATVSKQGNSTSGSSSSSSTTNPPSTSEKVVTTTVRTPSGKPVVIGGLIQQDTEKTISKVPILGDIPLLGLLFQNPSVTIDNTELVIYIVPHVEYPEPKSVDLSRKLSYLYQHFVHPEVTVH